MNKKFAISNCEVCTSTDLLKVLDLGSHPMCDDLVPVGDPAIPQKYPISILYCDTCKTAHQQFQIPKSTLFPAAYHYRSRLTADVVLGMQDLVNTLEHRLGSLSQLRVLDIGCNDGSLLDKFAEKGCDTFGVEPTGAHLDALNKGHCIYNNFFDVSTAKRIASMSGKVDVVTFTNVFAHIENLPGLLDALREVMHDKTLLVIENHYLGAILSGNQFDTFYHEHPRTYSLGSFVYIAESLDRYIESVQFPKRYGGNIRVIIGGDVTANVTNDPTPEIQYILDQEESFEQKFAHMRGFIDRWKTHKSDEIKMLCSTNGPLAAKAFPGRAAILIQLLGLSEQEIECVYEKPDSPKVGHYVPGTRIPIISDAELFPRISSLDHILNLAWHIPNEISTYLKSNGFNGELINII